MDYTDKKKLNETEVLTWLKDNLNEQRFLHSLGCAKCAVELAEIFNQNTQKAYIAGLLHDCAKCFKKEDMLKIARELNLDEAEFINYKVLHAPVSAHIAEKEFNIKDKEILSSIRWHTLGKMNMSEFEKIIFLADKIEPNTRDFDFRGKVLLLLKEQNGLNQAILLCYKETIKSLLRRDLKICQTTIDIYNSIL